MEAVYIDYNFKQPPSSQVEAYLHLLLRARHDNSWVAQKKGRDLADQKQDIKSIYSECWLKGWEVEKSRMGLKVQGGQRKICTHPISYPTYLDIPSG